MTSSPIVRASRRRFLQYLAASPLVASGAIEVRAMEAPSKWPDPMIWVPADRELIKSPKDAINVFDFEPVAHKNVPPAHFGYMASGIDDEVTLRANREGFLKFQLRPRRLNDVSKVVSSCLAPDMIRRSSYAQPGATSFFILMVRWQSQRLRASAIIFRFSLPPRTSRWRLSPVRAERQSGSSFMLRRNGRSRRR